MERCSRFLRINAEKRYVILLGIANDLSDRRSIVVLEASADREGQQLFRHCSDKYLGPIEQALLQPVNSLELPTVG